MGGTRISRRRERVERPRHPPHFRQDDVRLVPAGRASASTGCRSPVEKIYPFSKMPKGYVHGVPPIFYATAMPVAPHAPSRWSSSPTKAAHQTRRQSRPSRQQRRHRPLHPGLHPESLRPRPCHALHAATAAKAASPQLRISCKLSKERRPTAARAELSCRTKQFALPRAPAESHRRKTPQSPLVRLRAGGF